MRKSKKEKGRKKIGQGETNGERKREKAERKKMRFSRRSDARSSMVLEEKSIHAS